MKMHWTLWDFWRCGITFDPWLYIQLSLGNRVATFFGKGCQPCLPSVSLLFNCICLPFPLMLRPWCGSECIGSWIHLFTFLTILFLTIKWTGIQYCMCAQRRLRSACASEQSDQSLRCPPEDALDPLLPIECPSKTLIRLRGWRRLIWVFAGRICNLVGNAVPRLILIFLSLWFTFLLYYTCTV